MTDTPTPTPQPPRKRTAPRAEQDQQMANDIAAAGELIQTVRGAADIAALMATRGYDSAELDAGDQLVKAADAAFGARSSAMARQKDASAAVAGVKAHVRQAYVDFRQTVRAVFSEAGARTALGVTSKVPGDAQIFLTAARASYQAALSTPYAAALAKYGYPEAALTSALAMLDSFAAGDVALEHANGAAKAATRLRDQAFRTLSAWVKKFKRLARVALRDKPGLAKELGV